MSYTLTKIFSVSQFCHFRGFLLYLDELGNSGKFDIFVFATVTQLVSFIPASCVPLSTPQQAEKKGIPSFPIQSLCLFSSPATLLFCFSLSRPPSLLHVYKYTYSHREYCIRACSLLLSIHSVLPVHHAALEALVECTYMCLCVS